MDYEGKQIINDKGGVNMQGINEQWAAREAAKDREIVELREKLGTKEREVTDLSEKVAAYKRYYDGAILPGGVSEIPMMMTQKVVVTDPAMITKIKTGLNGITVGYLDSKDEAIQKINGVEAWLKQIFKTDQVKWGLSTLADQKNYIAPPLFAGLTKRSDSEAVKADLCSQIDELKRESQTLKASIEVVQNQSKAASDLSWVKLHADLERVAKTAVPISMLNPETKPTETSEAFPLVEPFISERKYIVLSGPIGVGKSTLTKQISRLPGFVPFFEEPDENPYLPRFYEGESVSFPMQQYFLAQFMEQSDQIRAELECGNRVVQDRSIYEVLHIFSKHQQNTGQLSSDEWATQERMCRAAFTTMPKPDLILILDADPDALIERIASRGREYEKRIDVSFLSDIRALYRKWVKLLLSEGAYEEGSGKTPQSGPWAGTRFAVLDVISGSQVMSQGWLNAG